MRKITQHSVIYDAADDRIIQFAVCDDGTMWERVNFWPWKSSEYTIPDTIPAPAPEGVGRGDA